MPPISHETYLHVKAQNPGKYARDLAALLHISEAELIDARVSFDALRLDSDARTLLAAVAKVGEVKAITRNEFAVHEQVGEYTNQQLEGHAGLILNPRALDLRLFLSHWQSIYALSEDTAQGIRHSLQFFDLQGTAVHKIYATAATHLEQWAALIEKYQAKSPLPLRIEPAPQTDSDKGDTTGLDTEWRQMTDIHQFFPLLRRRQLTRQQAFRAVSDELAYQVDNGALTQILHAAAQDNNEIMIFVGNKGCVQIFTGDIAQVTPHGEWINVFNERFTLHVLASAIAESWVTRKPTRDGYVTSLELFAADGSQIAQLFGQRSEGHHEQRQWRDQIAALIPQGATV